MENRRHIDDARKAIEKGEAVTWTMDAASGKFITGERALSEFLAGQRSKFEFYGSFKPQDDLKGIRERHAPGKTSWEIVAASPRPSGRNWSPITAQSRPSTNTCASTRA